MMNILEAIVGVVLIILVMIVVFGGLIYYDSHGEINFIPRLHIFRLTAKQAKKKSDNYISRRTLIKTINESIHDKTLEGKYELFVSVWSKAYNKDIAEHYQNLGFKVTDEKDGYIISWGEEA